ncbi:cadherin-like beta sandwich domain-containing protein [Paenibacillus sp. IB182496]|uniref:Cadherin-like beta sandwich domain-containing protein n=1 Tax=Paenibacillus sabuli TaxID=2772509 RepID=A0A927BY27_9BACL|nr:family 16 glycoside hydrolase [Paenibacillus sabuli]MBD2847594.1 cadherin-like beta sandwich domain-containing protein [Paenibacillus sabuli]
MQLAIKKSVMTMLSLLVLLGTLGLTVPPAPAAAAGGEFIIDNGDPGFDQSGFSDATSVRGYNGSSTVYTGYYGSYATWTPAESDAFEPGEYTVYVYLVKRTSGNATAELEVHHGGAASPDAQPFDLDQQAASGFEELGTYTFTGAAGEYVRLAKQTGSSGYVHADAVKFVRAPDGNTNARLADLSIQGGGVLDPAFSPTVTAYTYEALPSTASIVLVPTAEDAAAEIRVNGQVTASGEPAPAVTLQVGYTDVEVEVRAEDRSYRQTYALTVFRAPQGGGGPAVLENDAYIVTGQADRSFVIEQKASGASAVFDPTFTVVYSDDNPRKGTGKLTGAPWRSGNGDVNYTVLAWDGNTDFSAAPGTRAVHTATYAVYDGAAIDWLYERGDGYTLHASLALEPGSGEPQLSYTLTPSAARYYSVGFTGAPGASPEQTDWIYQPPIWQEQRVPDKSYLTEESRSTLPVVMYGQQGRSVGVAADPQQLPFRLATLANSGFGLLIRDDAGQMTPSVYAPVYGGEGSYRAEPYTFALRLFVREDDSYGTYKHLAKELFAFDAYRENGETTLNETLDNLVDFILNTSGYNYSYWDEEYKAYDYVNDKPGYGRQQSAVYALALAMVRDSRELYEERALPTIEYLASRKTQYTKLNGYDAQYPMGGPVRNYIEDWVTLYEMTGSRTPAFAELFEDGMRLKAANLGAPADWKAIIDAQASYTREQALDHAKRWLQPLMAAYRLTGESEYLSDARKVADDYIAYRLEEAATDYYDAQSSFWTDLAPMYYALLELYELTGEAKYEAAFVAGMKPFAQYIQLAPQVPEGEVTLGGQTVPAWSLSEIGLTSEAAGTSHSHRGIFMPYYSGYLALAAAYADDDFLRDLAASSLIGRYGNYPGYTLRGEYSPVFGDPDYPLQWYATYSNTAHMNHPLPMASMIIEYMVADAFDRSERGIVFPSRYSDTGAYFKNKVYGDRPGRFYDEQGVNLWMPKELLTTDNKQANYIAGYGNGKLYLALTNPSDTAQTVTVQLNEELVTYGASHTARLWQGDIEQGAVQLLDGAVTVTIAAGGLTALAIDGVTAQTELQQELQSSGDGQLRRTSMAQACTPFGSMSGMVLSAGPELSSAYLYASTGQDAARSMTLHYAIDGGAWQTMTRDRYPFEFTVPLGSGAEEIVYYMVDSEERSSEEQRLWLSEAADTGSVTDTTIEACPQPEPLEPDPGEEPSGPPVLAYTEDFESGAPQDWSAPAGTWTAVTEGTNNGVYRIDATTQGQEEGMLLGGDVTWSDYAVAAKVKAHANGTSGYASGITARASDADNLYLLRLHWSLGKAQLLKKQDGVWTTLKGSDSLALELEQWYTLKLDVQGNQLRGYVDGELVLEMEDDSLSYGGIGARVWNQEVSFDDYQVWLYDTPRRMPLYDEDFEDGQAAGWTYSGGGTWTVGAEDQSQALRHTSPSGEGIASAGSASWTDYAVEADIRYLNASTIIQSGLAARYADVDNYYLLRLFSDTSTVQLFKKQDGQMTALGEASMSVVAGQWYRLKLEVEGERIRGYVNGVQRIAVSDSEPLTAGGIAIVALDEPLAADNVKATAILTPRKLAVLPELRELEIDGTLQLEALLADDDSAYPGVRWYSDAPEIATVDAAGLVTGHAAGEAKIRAVPISTLPEEPVHPVEVSVTVTEASPGE